MAELYPVLRCVGRVRKLDDDWSTCNDVGTSGQEISAHDRFQHAAFARGLAANNNDLGHLNWERNFGPVEDFLQFVDQRDEFLH